MRKTALITGATSGIGQAAARLFAEAGFDIIITGRREEKLMALAGELSTKVKTTAIVQDVRNRQQVETQLKNLPQGHATLDVLVNNAGLAAGKELLQDGNPENWDRMIDTNVKGLLNVTKTVLPIFLNQGFGHVINIGSIAGKDTYPGGNIYCASKFAVEAITRGLRMDLVGKNIRVSQVSPGLTETEFSLVRFDGDAEAAKKVYQNVDPLTANDIAEIILWVAQQPPHVNIQDVVVTPTAQASFHHIHRKS